VSTPNAACIEEFLGTPASTSYLANNGVGCFTLCPDLRQEKGRGNHQNKNGSPPRRARSVTPYEL
jgi:hypothetical protein